MKRSPHYSTRQSEAVLAYIASLDGRHITAAQILEHFQSSEGHIGRTTIYRQLEKLVEDGKVLRYSCNGSPGACYQYVGGIQSEEKNCHLKCENCGSLFHLEDEVAKEISRRLFEKKGFIMDNIKTVFYGVCSSCAKEESHV
ncbi:MAG: transcriptional repressor [Oscillospiraceae bacterium]|jgi:Fur family ferric uptake transcriptional regulator|nr:transcriptional repressor [Oscillospiraceae bacterium]